MMYSINRPTRLVRGIAGAVAVGATFVTLGGCGKSSYQLDTAPCTGKVSIDGRPLASGYVTFITTRGRMSSGTIQPDGSFEMSTYEPGDGAQIGTHPVVITPIPSDEYSGGVKPIPVPVRYTKPGTSGFTIDVKPGEDNYIELPLTTQPQKK